MSNQDNLEFLGNPEFLNYTNDIIRSNILKHWTRLKPFLRKTSWQLLMPTVTKFNWTKIRLTTSSLWETSNLMKKIKKLIMISLNKWTHLICNSFDCWENQMSLVLGYMLFLFTAINDCIQVIIIKTLKITKISEIFIKKIVRSSIILKIKSLNFKLSLSFTQINRELILIPLRDFKTRWEKV